MGTTTVEAPTTQTEKVIEITVTEAGVSAVSHELRRLFDEQAEQIFAMTDVIAERARKLGATTLHSIGDIARYQRIQDNNETTVVPEAMLAELGFSRRSFRIEL
jgi:hypothetical protein